MVTPGAAATGRLVLRVLVLLIALLLAMTCISHAQMASVADPAAANPTTANDGRGAGSGDIPRSVTEITVTASAPKQLKPLSGYQELTIRDVAVAENSHTSEFQEGIEALLQQTLMARVQKAKLFPEVRAGESAADADAMQPTDEKQLELIPTIIGYRHGNRAQRIAGGLIGMGATSVEVQFVFRDGSTHAPLLTVIKQGSASMGTLGGSAEQTKRNAITEAVKRLVSEIKHYR